MIVYWPTDAKQTFGTEILRADHLFEQSDLFSNSGLATLLDLYPRNALEIWTSGETGDGRRSTLRGRAPRMPGKDIVEAVKHGQIWLTLRQADLSLPVLQPMAAEIHRSLSKATARNISRPGMNLIISSPNVQSPYRLDLSMSAMFQIRGSKRLRLFPCDEKHVAPEHIEQMVHQTRSNVLPFRDSFDKHARIFDLKPGMGVTWPQFSPYRIQNTQSLNVSLSYAFTTFESAVNTNAIYANALLRQKMKLSPKTQKRVDLAALAKATYAQAHKSLNRFQSHPAPTPITFELDMSVENCVKPLWV